MNYGQRGKDLLLDLKRSDWLPAYNDENVRAVLSEIKLHFDAKRNVDTKAYVNLKFLYSPIDLFLNLRKPTKMTGFTSFLGCFLFQPTAEPNRPNNLFQRCCHSTSYIFHRKTETSISFVFQTHPRFRG